MLDQQTILYAESGVNLDIVDADQLLRVLRDFGYCLLRGYEADLTQFSGLVNRLCTEVTFDPARVVSAESVQKVDAGVAPIGLHIENGNTPRVPHVLGFYCRTAARHGSQTTVCDGQSLWQEMPGELKSLLNMRMTVTRTLTEGQWKSYLAQEHPALQCADQVTELHLQQMVSQFDDLTATMNADGSLTYRLSTNPVRYSRISKKAAFANTILGPSVNYEAPVFRLDNGYLISADLISRLSDFCEQHTVEINWRDGDVVLIDNWRVMHGRRAIADAKNRELFVGMGMVR